MVSSAAKRARKKKLAHERQDRESLRPTRQMDPAELTDPEMEQEDDEVRFAPRGQSVEQMPATPKTAQAATGCMEEDIVNMIKTLNGAIAAISRDTASIQRAYTQLRAENVARDKTLADLAEIVKEYGLTSTTRRPQPVLREDVIDGDGNLRTADIGITWEVILYICARPSGSSSDLLKYWGGGSVAVACGARLSCSVFMVYSVLLSVSLVAPVSLVAHAPI